MLNKLKEFLGLEAIEATESAPAANKLLEVRALQVENRELKEIIKKQNALLQELSEDNMQLGRDRRRLADIAATQQRLIDVYESQAG